MRSAQCGIAAVGVSKTKPPCWSCFQVTLIRTVLDNPEQQKRMSFTSQAAAGAWLAGTSAGINEPLPARQFITQGMAAAHVGAVQRAKARGEKPSPAWIISSSISDKYDVE